jgi:hypothetical protein
MYYSALDTVGIPKRDIMVHRVEAARDTQHATKQQFKSALEQFQAVTQFNGGDLEEMYQKLNNEYESSVDMASAVHKKITDIEDVSEALFEEWEDELEQYSSATLKQSSQSKLDNSRNRYQQLIAAMKQAESKIKPVLALFKDQVLYLKHNLNATAITALKGELKTVETDVSILIDAMEKSIDEANSFIKIIAG